MNAPGKVLQQAERAQPKPVDIHTHRVIYELADNVKRVLEEAIEPVLEERIIGQVEHTRAMQSPMYLPRTSHASISLVSQTEVAQLFTLTLNRNKREAGMSKQTQVRVADGSNPSPRAHAAAFSARSVSDSSDG